MLVACSVSLLLRATEQATNLYTPAASLEDLVLPEGVGERLVAMLTAHGQLREYSRRV